MDISVVIPCFNGQKFIERALNSILQQTLPVHEIIIVDDGSSDESIKIIKQWMLNNTNTKLQLFSQKNKGVSIARNKGCMLANSDWISFLDVDDIWYPNHNEVLFNLVKSIDNCIFAFCDAERCQTSNGKDKLLPTFFTNAEVLSEFEENNQSTKVTIHSSLHRKLLTGSFIPTCSNIVKREACLSIHGFEENRAYGEDRQFWLKLIAMGDVVATTEIIGRQNYHETNATHRRHAIKQLIATIDLADNLMSHIDLYKLEQDEINIIKKHKTFVLNDLTYTLSLSGIEKMYQTKSKIKNKITVKFKFKDIIRGVLASLNLK